VSADQIFQALGDATRRTMIERLCERPHTVSSLAGPLHISLAAVVQHLQVLEACGLVRSEKVGRVRTCRVDPRGFTKAEAWFAARRTSLERKLDRLGELLAEEDT
jgi:DNA-binding transcriptional ArsR family regulator